ncbi:MAG TPA: YtxH domain-containing protein [Gaiellaceae bacterium]
MDRALNDEELREHVKQAYAAARTIYDELIAPRGMVTAAQRVAGDQDLQDNFRVALAELREAAGRLQGQRQEKHAARSLLLLIGVVAGLLYNPFTGPETRRWLKDKLFGGSDEFGFDESGNGGIGAA